MNLDDWQLIFISVCLVLVLIACGPVVVALLPSMEESFFVLAVLGEEDMAEHYYPDDDPRIEVGEEVHWKIYLNNRMGEVKYIAVRVKLLNSTMLNPNSSSLTPSSAPVVHEIRRVILDNETWFYPFFWSINNTEFINSSLEIKLLIVNSESVVTRSIAEEDFNYRFIFELWVYDENLKDFRFGWGHGEEFRCAWNQVWFNANSAISR